jgi:hypothetical protein
MHEIIARKIIDENGEEIIELDLNKAWPKKKHSFTDYPEDMETQEIQKQRKSSKEFISILN